MGASERGPAGDAVLVSSARRARGEWERRAQAPECHRQRRGRRQWCPGCEGSKKEGLIEDRAQVERDRFVSVIFGCKQSPGDLAGCRELRLRGRRGGECGQSTGSKRMGALGSKTSPRHPPNQ